MKLFLFLSLSAALFFCIIILFNLKNRPKSIPRRQQSRSDKPQSSNLKPINLNPIPINHRDPEEIFPVKSRNLLSDPEQILYFRLCKALPDYIILSQISLSRIVDVKKGHNFYSWHNRFNRMTVDFVICDKSFKILSIIELDDKSHNTSKRQDQDAKKNKVLNDANIPLIRWKNIPDEKTIQEKVFSLESK